MRRVAASAFGKLDKSVMGPHVEALVALLQDEDSSVRRATTSAFGQLDKSLQEQHVEALAALHGAA